MVLDDIGELAQIRAWLDAARRITVLTGAGVSTPSGIPDFRGPKGLWTRNPAAEKASDIIRGRTLAAPATTMQRDQTPCPASA